MHCVLGRFDEAFLLFEEARQADPLAAFPYAVTGAGLVDYPTGVGSAPGVVSGSASKVETNNPTIPNKLDQ